jgi:hypothetical protein
VIEHSPGELAITDAELRALRRHLHQRIGAEVQAFWKDHDSERQRLEKHEQELAKRRREIESRHAAALLKKRRTLPKIDWTSPPDFEAEAAGKVHQQNLDSLDRQFNLETLLGRLAPLLYEFASLVAIFERTVISNLPSSQRPAYCKSVVAAIVRIIMPSTYTQEPLPPEAKNVRLFEEKVWGGRIIAGPCEILLDEHRRVIGYRRAPYAERRGEFENSPLGNLWGLLHAPGMARPRRRLHLALKAHARSELVQIAGDGRTRRQMVEDCQGAHGVTHKEIAAAARVSINDFYQWRSGNPRIGPKKHRRILFVVCCPVWPPPHI